MHDQAKVITDLAVCLALGGDTVSDVALLRAEPDLYDLVASDPTVSRTIDALAGEHAPDHGVSTKAPLIIDVDAALVTSHSDN